MKRPSAAMSAVAAKRAKITPIVSSITEAGSLDAAVKELMEGSLKIALGEFKECEAHHVKELTDHVVTLAPYFKIKDLGKFKQIWQEDYKNFAHKEDCVQYAWCFTDDNRAHCYEAYPSADKLLQHLADADVALKAALDGPAELERLEVHGPRVEVDKLRDALTPLGCLFYVTEWGFRPAKPAMEKNTVCHLSPYFKLKQPEDFKKIWYDAFPATKANQEAEKTHQYAWTFEDTGDVASCRESYGDAEGMLLHLKNVDSPLKAVLDGPAELLRLEVHAPASEIEMLRPHLEPLGCQFFATGWGFQNAVAVPEKVRSPEFCHH